MNTIYQYQVIKEGFSAFSLPNYTTPKEEVAPVNTAPVSSGKPIIAPSSNVGYTRPNVSNTYEAQKQTLDIANSDVNVANSEDNTTNTISTPMGGGGGGIVLPSESEGNAPVQVFKSYLPLGVIIGGVLIALFKPLR